MKYQKYLSGEFAWYQNSRSFLILSLCQISLYSLPLSEMPHFWMSHNHQKFPSEFVMPLEYCYFCLAWSLLPPPPPPLSFSHLSLNPTAPATPILSFNLVNMYRSMLSSLIVIRHEGEKCECGIQIDWSIIMDLLMSCPHASEQNVFQLKYEKWHCQFVFRWDFKVALGFSLHPPPPLVSGVCFPPSKWRWK